MLLNAKFKKFIRKSINNKKLQIKKKRLFFYIFPLKRNSSMIFLTKKLQNNRIFFLHLEFVNLII